MGDHEVRTVVSGMAFTECPRWHDGRLWFADFYTHAIYSVAEDGSDLRTEVEVPQQPSGIGWLPDGRLLYVSMRDRKVMRLEPDGASVEHADVSAYVGGHPNDMVVDAEGRAYLGNFGFDLMAGADIETAALLRIDPDGTVTQVADDLWFPNGSVITPDGSTLIVDETVGNRISAFDIAADGSLGERRDWAVFGGLPTTRALGEAIGQAALRPRRLLPRRRRQRLDRRRPRRPGLPGQRGRRDPRDDHPRHRRVRLHARRQRRPHAVHLLRAGLRRARPQRRPRGRDPRGDGRRPARRPALAVLAGPRHLGGQRRLAPAPVPRRVPAVQPVVEHDARLVEPVGADERRDPDLLDELALGVGAAEPAAGAGQGGEVVGGLGGAAGGEPAERAGQGSDDLALGRVVVGAGPGGQPGEARGGRRWPAARPRCAWRGTGWRAARARRGRRGRRPAGARAPRRRRGSAPSGTAASRCRRARGSRGRAPGAAARRTSCGRRRGRRARARAARRARRSG